MIKIAHIADCHLRVKQYGFKARGDDFFAGLKNAIQAALDNGASLILCSGDIVDTTYPSAEVIKYQLPAIADLLEQNKATMLVTSGNHDLTSPHWCSGLMRDKGGILVVDNERYIHDDRISIYGAPFTDPDRLRETVLQNPDTEADILMWHGEIKELIGYPKANTIEAADFPTGKYQVIAMGDQHIHKYIEHDGLVIAYPGSTELCSTSEDTEKQLYMYSFNDEGKLESIDSVPFTTRPVQKLKLLTDVDVEQAIVSLIPGALIFVEYDRNLHNVVPRLTAAITDEDTILRATVTEAIKSNLAAPGMNRDEEIPTLAQFMQLQLEKVTDAEEYGRIHTLCDAMIDPNQDHRAGIDRFCEDTLGKIVL